jgi:hypothetical protein
MVSRRETVRPIREALVVQVTKISSISMSLRARHLRIKILHLDLDKLELLEVRDRELDMG